MYRWTFTNQGRSAILTNGVQIIAVVGRLGVDVWVKDQWTRVHNGARGAPGARIAQVYLYRSLYA